MKIGRAAQESTGNLGVFGAAIIGERSEQQDAFRLRWLDTENAWLIVLADGMGGHTGGALASKIAVDGFVAAFIALRAQRIPLDRCFLDALNDANARIAKAQHAKPEFADMGTTLVAAHLSSEGLRWISVGDSPVWLLRQARLYRLNEDHSLRGAVSGVKGIGNMLQSVLNGQPIPMIDHRREPVEIGPQDVCIFASDGILTLSEAQIAQTLEASNGGDPQSLTEALLRGVAEQRKSNQDNCTIVVAAPVGRRATAAWRDLLRDIAAPQNLAPILIGAVAGFSTVFAAYYLFKG